MFQTWLAMSVIASMFLLVGTGMVNAQYSNSTGNSTNSTSPMNTTNTTLSIGTTEEDGVGGIAGIRLGDGG